MLVLALLSLATAQQAAPKAITLSRVFTANERMSYEVKSHITLENRARGLETFLPEDYDMKYDFTAAVKEMKVDGIAVVHYQRPTMTEIDGETYDSTPTAKTKKVNYDYLLTVSPINEILDKVDLTPPTPDKSGSKAGGDGMVRRVSTTPIGVGKVGVGRPGVFAPSSTSLRRFAPTPGYFFEPLRGAVSGGRQWVAGCGCGRRRAGSGGGEFDPYLNVPGVVTQISTTPIGVGMRAGVPGDYAPSSTSLRRFAPTPGYFFEPLRGAESGGRRWRAGSGGGEFDPYLNVPGVMTQISTTPIGVGMSGAGGPGVYAPSSTSLRRFAPTPGYFFEPLRGAGSSEGNSKSRADRAEGGCLFAPLQGAGFGPVFCLVADAVGIEQEQDDATDQVAQFVTELYRLALFNGPMESSLDFAPKFPFNDVLPGDTWKRTVGYQPQALKGKKGQEPVVQRLDYTYTYRGLVNVEGKTFQRVTADLSLNTDLAAWANQDAPKGSPDDGPQLTKMPMNLKATIEFDLDPKTFDTVAARAYSQGGFQVYMSDAPNQIYFESKLKGSTTLSLRSITR